MQKLLVLMIIGILGLSMFPFLHLASIASEAPAVEWSKRYSGATPVDVLPNTVIQTSDGGYALAGTTSSFGHGARDFWLVKTTANGDMQWNQTYGGTSNDKAGSVVRTLDGGYTLAGYTNSFSGDGSYEVWLIKLAGSGPRTWIVDDDGPADFHTIQEAINAASDGDTVFVRNGTYYENVVVNKTVSLIGEEPEITIVDGSIQVFANNVTVSGFSVTHEEGWVGIWLDSSNDCLITGNILHDCSEGIFLLDSSNNVISGNKITNDFNGTQFIRSSGNSIVGNIISNNFRGITCDYSNNGVIRDNVISNNVHSFATAFSSNNSIYHNNFLNNTYVFDWSIFAHEIWDNCYPSGGNFWSDYTGNDTYSGAYQNETGSDNIGDTPYVIDANNQDNYPLMSPYVHFVNQTIYIRADGNVDPSGAPILRQGDLYTLTDSITCNADGIVIERDNMTLDGAGSTLQGAGSGTGVDLSGRTNVTARNIQTKTFTTGIYLSASSNYNSISGNNITANNWCGIGVHDTLYYTHNNISGNNITNNGNGILLYSSSNSIFGNNITNNNGYGIGLLTTFWLGGSCSNSISDNNIANNGYGIDVHYSCNYNTISGNKIANNDYGIRLRECFNNEFYHNTFINNTKQVYDLSWDNPSFSHSINVWDNGYPSGGNYWSDYAGADFYSGPFQNETGSDNIGDSPYVIDANNMDHYPLMPPHSTPTISVDPSTTSIFVGQLFNVSIRASDVSDLYLWVFSIRWDPNVLEYDSIAEGDFLSRGGSTTGILVKEINQTGGYLEEATCSLLGSVPGVSGDGTLATITFRAKAAGLSPLETYFHDLVDSNGTSIVSTPSDGLVNVTAPDLCIADVSLPYPSLPKYANVTVPVNVTVMNTGTADAGAFNVSCAMFWNDGGLLEQYEEQRIASLETNTTTTINLHLTPLHNGSYTLTFKVDCNNEIVESNETNNQLSLPITVNIQGDINGDGRVDYRDLFILAKAYWSTPPDSNWDARADLNYDGVVGYKDLFILERNYSS